MKRIHVSLLILMLVSLTILPGLGCKGGSREAKDALEPVALDYWRVFDGSDTFSDIISKYQQIHPNVTINYRKLRFEEYEDELLRAFAEGRGPDMFSVHNTWMKEYQQLIKPLPDIVQLTYSEEKGTLKKERVITLRNETTMSVRELSDDYVQVVEDYAVYPSTDGGTTKNRIYGLPLSVDTLALFYNKDILDAAGIPKPPVTWQDLVDDVVTLTKYDVRGDVAQSGAAIGTGANVERAADIISLLMMQSEATMTDTRGTAKFAEMVSVAGQRYTPAVNALAFYTEFSNPTKEAYTWDRSFPNSFDAFAAGQTAFFFGYSYHVPLLDAKSGKLNYAITHMPQVVEDSANRMDYANFWLETVAKSSDSVDWAWDFLQFASKEQNVKSYLSKAEKPTALRSLVLEQKSNSNYPIFADQVLSARAWYNGSDATSAEDALVEMIDSVVDGTYLPEEALKIAQQQVNQTL